MKHLHYLSAAVCCLLLAGCGDSEAESMVYVKSSTTYDTLSEMYNNPDAYLGKTFHIVGTLYETAGDNGEKLYSVYAPDSHGDEGIGLELDWNDFSGIAVNDRITVEGRLDKDKGTFNGKETEYLVLRVSSLEKRD